MMPLLLVLGGGYLLLRKKAPGVYDTEGGGDALQDPVRLRSQLTGVLKFLHDDARYGPAIARNVERIYRLETNDFTSEQFRRTNTAGQVATKSTFSFGWSPRGTTPDAYGPVVTMTENAGGAPKMFVNFKSLPVAMVFLATVMKERGNDPGKWKTLAGSASYRAAVANMPTPIVDAIAG